MSGSGKKEFPPEFPLGLGGVVLTTTNNTPDEKRKADGGHREACEDGEEGRSDSDMTRAEPDVTLCAVSSHAVTLCPVLRVNPPIVVSGWSFGRSNGQCMHR